MVASDSYVIETRGLTKTLRWDAGPEGPGPQGTEALDLRLPGP